MGFDRARSRSRSPAGYEREDGEVTPEGSDHAAEDLLLGPEERERRERDLIERRRRERAAILERHNRRKEFEITQARSGTTTTSTSLKPPPTAAAPEPDARPAALPQAKDDLAETKPAPSRDADHDHDDTFASDDGGDDMFAEEDSRLDDGAGDMAEGRPPANHDAEPPGIRGKGLADDWDDAEGYYNFRVGEVLRSPVRSYEVYANCGQGVFSTVLRAREVGGRKDGPEFAIKVVRNNEVMRKAAEQEVNILRKLKGADPEGKRHCIHLVEHFEYRSHVCMCFEALDLNLREVVKKFGREVGINLKAVRTYSYQLLQALRLLRTCGILHADIKPDNVLVNASRSKVKLCDLGSAMYAGDNELTPYLVSRFYRAPEVILGLPYGYAMDMWSLGCVVYELFTGKIAFPGDSNNHMLKLMMDLKGGFPKKMLKRGTFVERHFDDDVNATFYLLETDPVTGQPARTAVSHPKATRDLFKELEAKAGVSTDRKKLHQFADFLGQMFMLSPDRRITVSSALGHPFISEPM